MTSVRDIIVVAVVLFALAVILLVSINVNNQVLDRLKENPSMNSTNASRQVLEKGDQALFSLDYVYFSFFIGLFLSIVIFGYLVGGYEIFAVIYFFLLIIFVVVSYILQTAWVELATSPGLITTAAALPYTNFIMNHLAIFICIFGLVGILVMYAKPYVQNQ